MGVEWDENETLSTGPPPLSSSSSSSSPPPPPPPPAPVDTPADVRISSSSSSGNVTTSVVTPPVGSSSSTDIVDVDVVPPKAAKKRVTIKETPCTSPILDPTSPLSPTSPVSPSSPDGDDDFDQILGELQCPICLDVYNSPVTLSCGHTLCNEHVSELAAMFNHVDTGKVELDCPKCRVRCSFPGEVKVNLEMKNMIVMVKKAAKKTREQRRSEREHALVAKIKGYEKNSKELQRKEQQLQHDRQQWEGEKKKLEGVRENRPAASDPTLLERERQRLEREKQFLQQQREEMNTHSKHLILQQQHLTKLQQERGEGGGGAPHSQWDSMSADEKRRELDRMRDESEQQRQQEREARDRRIEEEMSQWMKQTDHINQLAIESRTAIHTGIRKIDTIEADRDTTPDPEPLPAPQTTPPTPPPPPQPSRFATIKQLPQTTTYITEVEVEPKEVIQPDISFQGRINPITGFPDPAPREEVEGDSKFGKYFESKWRKQAYDMKPPRLVPEDYPNYQYSLTDGVDHELEGMMQKTDEQYRYAIEGAHKKRIVAEKARIAEQRANAMIAQYKAEQRAKRLAATGGWDSSGADTKPASAPRRPGSSGSSGSGGGGGGGVRRPKPSFQPKLGRRQTLGAVVQRGASNPVTVARRGSAPSSER